MPPDEEAEPPTKRAKTEQELPGHCLFGKPPQPFLGAGVGRELLLGCCLDGGGMNAYAMTIHMQLTIATPAYVSAIVGAMILGAIFVGEESAQIESWCGRGGNSGHQVLCKP